MHLATFLTLASSASLAVLPASARLDRRSSAHRELVHHQLSKRTPSAEPYRVFAQNSRSPSPGSFAALDKRDDGDLLEQIGETVQEVAVAWKLAVPDPHLALAAISTHKVDEEKKQKQKEEADAAAASASASAKAKAKAKKLAAQKKKEQKEKDAAERKKAQAAAKKKAEEEAAAKKLIAQRKKAAKVAAQKKAAEEALAAKASEEKVVKPSSSVANLGTVSVQPISLLGFKSDNCGSSEASDDQPNGGLNWLNCGISKSNPSGGWTPPDGVTLARITTVSVEHALKTNSVWKPCSQYANLFDKVADETGLPAILLASFALQESTCDKNCVGGGGEVGLMQITEDKCGGRSRSECADPEYNVRTAAKYFKQELDNQGGQVLKAIGAYNGWYSGLSYEKATAARWSSCCRCQNNLDYLYQMMNGWLLGRTGYELSHYNNLAVSTSSQPHPASSRATRPSGLSRLLETDTDRDSP
ncbi:hypothetical protein JCM11641_003764 [Rhodosporidiobolus odoratus]